MPELTIFQGSHLLRPVFLTILITPLLCLLCSTALAVSTHCPDKGVYVQVLGSGGPEVGDGRASSSYLVWLDGKARILIDAGGGSSDNFGRSGAEMADLDAILFTHFHVDHSADLPALVKSSFFDNRRRDLPIYGPSGNYIMPDTEDFLISLFDIEGAFRYLAAYLDDGRSNGYRLQPKVIETDTKQVREVFSNSTLAIKSVPVHHGSLPALAWQIDIAGKMITFSGDMNNEYQTLATLAKNTDLLVAHNAVPKGARGVERNLHMPPVEIGKIAAKAETKQLVLSHRMRRTLGREEETLSEIRRHYSGPVKFADDMDCFRP